MMQKKVQVQQQKKNQTKIKKALSRYQTNILLQDLKFTPTSKRNNIELKSNIQNYSRRMQLAEFFQNKEANDSEENLFQKPSTFTPPQDRDRDLGHQIDVLNTLNLEKMEAKSKSNLSYMEQKELSKLSNDETIVIKRADKGEAVVILSTGHYQSMIMQHLSDENTYKKKSRSEKLWKELRQLPLSFKSNLKSI